MMTRPTHVRRRDIIEKVRAEVDAFESSFITHIRQAGHELQLPGLHVHIAKEFGFCNGVRRAIEIAFAAIHAFPGRRISLIGEIIHNNEVNKKLAEKGILRLPWQQNGENYQHLTRDDVVIIPAFGIAAEARQQLVERGVQLVDSTCGNVLKVWKQVRAHAAQGATSIIHGKVHHEESMATASHARGVQHTGHYLIVATEGDAAYVAQFISQGGDSREFLQHFDGCYSPGFNPAKHLLHIGLANQTTMLREETLRIQHLLRQAIIERDGCDARFHAFDAICGATQERQQALQHLLHIPHLNTVFVIGGYNSSNTTHLVKIAAAHKPTFFIKDATCLLSPMQVASYIPQLHAERVVSLPPEAAQAQGTWHVGITAGASCPARVIEEVIHRLAHLRTQVLHRP